MRSAGPRKSERVEGRDDRIVALYTQHGLATDQIGERFNITNKAVARVLRLRGIPIIPGRQRYNAVGQGVVRRMPVKGGVRS